VVEALPADFKARKADIFVAVALNEAQSHVSGGENKGRDIRHVAVAESIDKVGTVATGRNFDRDVSVKLKSVKVKSTSDLANLRLIAFVQEPDAGEVVGAALVNASLAAPTVDPSTAGRTMADASLPEPSTSSTPVH
jgi:hypothetical protein